MPPSLQLSLFVCRNGFSEEIEALAAKGVDLSASAGSGGVAAIHRAVLAGSTDALLSVGGRHVAVSH